MHIDSYTFGEITVNGRTYRSDLIVFPDKVAPDWWRVEGHHLQMEDLEDVLKYGPEILIIGKGASGCMEVSAEVRERLDHKGVEVIDRNTEEACRIFNEKIKEKIRAVGAFHLTC